MKNIKKYARPRHYKNAGSALQQSIQAFIKYISPRKSRTSNLKFDAQSVSTYSVGNSSFYKGVSDAETAYFFAPDRKLLEEKVQELALELKENISVSELALIEPKFYLTELQQRYPGQPGV